MNYRLANSLVKLRDQINAAYPNRDKSSDGWIGDATHASRKSDHNPWFKDSNGIGIVSAIDIDNDLGGGLTAGLIVDALVASRDPRIKYLIYNARITTASGGLITGDWRPYSGKNAHRHHFHLSVKSLPKFYDDQSDWQIAIADQSRRADRPVLKLESPFVGDEAVAEAQRLLAAAGFLKIGSDDGIFGPNTDAAVREFQRAKSLWVDGAIGPKTWAELLKSKDNS